MFKKISKTEEINARLERERKVTILDKPEHLKAMEEISRHMEDVRREYKIKQARSKRSAAEVILTC